MDTPSPAPSLPSPWPREEETPLASPPPVPRGRRGRPPRAASGGPAPPASSGQRLRVSLRRKRGRPPKARPEPRRVPEAAVPVEDGGGADLLLIDDQGVPYTVSEESAPGEAREPEPRRPEGPPARKPRLLCPVCLRAFTYLSDLERHSISHSELKPHACRDCGKTFKRSSHLRRHCNIHAGLRPFLCVLCPRRFREAGELAHHHRVHSGERPYQCGVCWQRFAEANTLRRHIKRKHPEAAGARRCTPDPVPEPPWAALVEQGIPAAAEGIPALEEASEDEEGDETEQA